MYIHVGLIQFISFSGTGFTISPLCSVDIIPPLEYDPNSLKKIKDSSSELNRKLRRYSPGRMENLGSITRGQLTQLKI